MNRQTKTNEGCDECFQENRNECNCGCEDGSKCLCMDEAVVQEVYKITATGIASIDIIRPFTQEKSLNALLNRQYAGYKELMSKAEGKAKEIGADLKSPAFFSKMMMYWGVVFNTLGDKSTSKIAEIMIQGVNMGIISITKVLNDTDSSETNVSLAEELSGKLTGDLNALKLYL